MNAPMNSSAPGTDVSLIEQPPHSWWGVLGRLGPGLIIAGSIVGSGELIATTTTGAKAGFSLLWLVVVGCVIKVWVQVELGRYTITSGQTTMQIMNALPGPALAAGSRRVNWLALYWLAMFLVSLGQLGGIVAEVGRALAIACPVTEVGREYDQLLDERAKLLLRGHRLQKGLETPLGPHDAPAVLEQRVREIEAKVYGSKEQTSSGVASLQSRNHDEKYWAVLVTIITSVVLVLGRYKLLEVATTLMVASFTALSVITVIMLQVQGEYAVSANELLSGLSFQLPRAPLGAALNEQPLYIALAAFGIIGVGANELIQYPYWCQEKGYARFTGPRDDTPAWIARARGWLTVLKWDAWSSMLVYTFATIAFYLLGAGVLGRLGLSTDREMIRTLAMMYEPIFGSWTMPIFLTGALAVLYSTFLIANAGHARVCADAVRVLALPQLTSAGVRGWSAFFSGLFPFICLAIYIWLPKSDVLIFASGAMQAVMLPMLGATAIYFRYTRMHPELAPSKVWDACLWLSTLLMLLAGIVLIVLKFQQL
jgi:Mn2+/Fe2+ NRAMP family transporter